ncbi:hypothetical protein H7J77_08655 [Mycolicibacillus parakoreensis]|uniref:Rv3235 family protein n=1 Tax=Mycolicibacillus parakoreensis TaxID=1069221 RepID=A0ABY3TYJ1_9MYCO|nr:Rv3235 family protein [Mycolicibacillus parakoreensis]MCV7315611.1 hypothetical protein [Mycolicibacillus parakoreensis]ULN51949.1 Rv3235 family protein [Mycolicibacillus parakoreensis]
MNDSALRRRLVRPAVDCEPPPQTLPAPARRPRRPCRPVAPPATAPPPSPAGRPDLRAAAAFADAALRRVLEVLDRRRPAPHLRAVLATPLLDALGTRGPAGPAARRPRRPRATAVLRRVRVQAVGPERPSRAVEVVASYVRGPRTHAIACRVERVQTRWQVVALHIG